MIPPSHQLKLIELSDEAYRSIVKAAHERLTALPDKTKTELEALKFLEFALFDYKHGVYG